jgi:hypothetical protein
VYLPTRPLQSLYLLQRKKRPSPLLLLLLMMMMTMLLLLLLLLLMSLHWLAMYQKHVVEVTQHHYYHYHYHYHYHHHQCCRRATKSDASGTPRMPNRRIE